MVLWKKLWYYTENYGTLIYYGKKLCYYGKNYGTIVNYSIFFLLGLPLMQLCSLSRQDLSAPVSFSSSIIFFSYEKKRNCKIRHMLKITQCTWMSNSLYAENDPNSQGCQFHHKQKMTKTKKDLNC